jgi:hypothetical protein
VVDPSSDVFGTNPVSRIISRETGRERRRPYSR